MKEKQTPLIVELDTNDWWIKVLAMLKHNWAVINENQDGTVTVYFFHDGGLRKNLGAHDYRSTRGMIAIVDSLEFATQCDAMAGLLRNGFSPLANLPGPWHGKEPKGKIFDARSTEPGVYSNEGYWLKED
jgi:hypothetical protein